MLVEIKIEQLVYGNHIDLLRIILKFIMSISYNKL